MKKEIVGILVCMLLVGTVLPVSATVAIKRTYNSSYFGNTLYVGGSGEGNYTKIQDAIDDANPGDTVFVYDESSPYYENLVVNKSISMIGENRETTVVDGGLSGEVIYVRGIDGVTVSGFTIRNGELGLHFLESYNNVITDNTVHDHKFPGIIFLVSGRNTITNNIVTNTYTGVYFFETSDSIIADNTFDSNNHSLYIKTLSNNNTFSNNSIGWSSHTGVFIYDRCEKNVFFENNIKHSLEILETCTENLFYHNNFIEEWGHARDRGSNNWDNGKEGNYWLFYKGYDLFPRDGIGDIPYDIPGGDNQDNYPLMKPWPNTRNRTTIDSYWSRLLEPFPILQKILSFIL